MVCFAEQTSDGILCRTDHWWYALSNRPVMVCFVEQTSDGMLCQMYALSSRPVMVYYIKRLVMVSHVRSPSDDMPYRVV